MEPTKWTIWQWQCWVTAQVLTFTRYILAPAIGFYWFMGDFSTASWLLVFCIVTDWLDGIIARWGKVATERGFGFWADMVSDRILMFALLTGEIFRNQLPLGLGTPLAAGWLSAAAYLLVVSDYLVLSHPRCSKTTEVILRGFTWYIMVIAPTCYLIAYRCEWVFLGHCVTTLVIAFIACKLPDIYKAMEEQLEL